MCPVSPMGEGPSCVLVVLLIIRSRPLPPSRSPRHRGGVLQANGQRFAVKCVKRADLPPEDEADLKMEVKLLQEVGPDLYQFSIVQ